MAPDEMAAEFGALRGQMAVLQQQNEAQRKHWSQCSLVAMIATIVLAVLLIAASILSIMTGRSDPITPVFGATMTVAMFLTIAFSRAAATLTVRQRPR